MTRSGGRGAAGDAGLPARVAVLGAGTMGTGIALVFATAGCEVELVGRRPERLRAALERIHERLGGPASRRRAVERRIRGGLDLKAACSGAGLVIETVAEDVAAKQEVLARAEAAAAGAAILGTNSSSLPVEVLSEALRRPERFAAYHWLNPADLVELVEIVPTARTRPAVIGRLRRWTEAVGKRPVVLTRSVDGFIANRLQYALIREAYALVTAGVCGIKDVDIVLTHGLGARWAGVGPFETLDLAGLDVHYAVASQLFPELARDVEPPAVVAELIHAGRLGCKSGQGLYGRYPPSTVRELELRRDTVLRLLNAAPPGAVRKPRARSPE